MSLYGTALDILGRISNLPAKEAAALINKLSVKGGDFVISGLDSMASDGCYRSRRMANRIAAARTADDRICMLQCEQHFVGDLGILRGRVCIDRITGLSFPDKPSRAQEKLKPQ